MVATLAGVFAVVYSLRFGYDIFFGPPSTDLPRQPHEPPRWMRVPIELLVLACLVVGIVPGAVDRPGARRRGAARSSAATLPEYSLAVWHGFNAPLRHEPARDGRRHRSATCWLRRQLARGRFERRAAASSASTAGALFERALVALAPRARARAPQLVGTRRLQPQLFAGRRWSALAARGARCGRDGRSPGATGRACRRRRRSCCCGSSAWSARSARRVQAKFHRLAALTLLGVAGLVTCLTFVWFSAPDLALTQLVVEVVTTVLFLLGLRWLPKRVEGRRPAHRDARAGCGARATSCSRSCAGAGLAALSYAMLTRPAPQSISPFFLEQRAARRRRHQRRQRDARRLPRLRHAGRDHRARRRRAHRLRAAAPLPAAAREHRAAASAAARCRPTSSTDLVQPRTAPDTRARLPDGAGGARAPAAADRRASSRRTCSCAATTSPAAASSPGLVVAIAFITQYMVAGTQLGRGAHRSCIPLRWIALGLLLALCTGLGALRRSAIRSSPRTPRTSTLPLLGDVHLPSAMFFDLGVFAVVVGATLLILIALAHQSIRSPPQAGAPSRPPTTRSRPDGSRRSRSPSACSAAAGVWLVLRPRTFQVIMGLRCSSYAVNLFIFSMGSLSIDSRADRRARRAADLLHYTDPLPQALVLTAIVISFATTALFLVVLLASRGLTGTDHVDGEEDAP